MCAAGVVLSHANHPASRTFVPRANLYPNTAPAMPLTFLRRLVRPSVFAATQFASVRSARPSIAVTAFQNATSALAARPVPSTRANKCTLIQVLRQGRIAQKARKLRSPQLRDRPELKGVYLKVGTTKPKKPNSGERKIARVRLSTGKVITAYIPGEGMELVSR